MNGGGSIVWHPFTQHALRSRFPKAMRAEGAYIFTADGRRIVDAISSWWVITHGHRHPRIVAAIREAADTLDQVIFAEYTHDSAERLAEKLLTVAPPGLAHVFFSDSGSTSVEVALKMALGYWHHSGEPRHRILVMEHSYHGDTVGAMSVGERGPFTDAYRAVVVRRCAHSVSRRRTRKHHVRGARGALQRRPGRRAHRRAARARCRRHAHVFAGRARRAAQHLREPRRAFHRRRGDDRLGPHRHYVRVRAGRISPDIACYSKGLTGGSLPLAVTLCRHEIFAAHFAEDRRRTFFHSSSFTANPIACAAALANLEIWESEPVLARIAALQALQAKHLERLRDDDRFEQVRQTGTITALDVRAPDGGYFAALGPRLAASFQAGEVLLRPLGNTLYVLPPYCVTADDLDRVYAAILGAVDALA